MPANLITDLLMVRFVLRVLSLFVCVHTSVRSFVVRNFLREFISFSH